MRYAVTGSTGHLGRLVIDRLLDTVAPGDIIAIARTPEKASDLAERGVVVREGDYDRPDTLGPALEGVDRLLLVSASKPGERARQHRAVIDAAVAEGVGRLVYTSILHADTSEIGLAEEHRQTEADIASSGLPHAFLRNGWYTENYTGSAGDAVQHGTVLGSAGDAAVAPATRADLAEAAAAVLIQDDPGQTVYELAGTPFTMPQYAAELAAQSGKEVVYSDLSEENYRAALQDMGLPEPVARMIAQADAAAADGALYDDSGDLSRLINRRPTPLSAAVSDALGG